MHQSNRVYLSPGNGIVVRNGYISVVYRAEPDETMQSEQKPTKLHHS